MEEIIQEFGSFILSTIAVIIAALKGKNKKLKTEEEIEAEEEAKKQKRVKKALKKNKITPKETINNVIAKNCEEVPKMAENTTTEQLKVTVPNINN